MTDMALIKIVRLALEAIDFCAPDMSPRVLRNTYARRLLLAGRTNEEVSALLGLASNRTVVRLRATIEAQEAQPSS
jgi:site-specific recombinase XerD